MATPGPIAAVVGTAAMALMLLGRAATIDEAEAQAGGCGRSARAGSDRHRLNSSSRRRSGGDACLERGMHLIENQLGDRGSGPIGPA